MPAKSNNLKDSAEELLKVRYSGKMNIFKERTLERREKLIPLKEEVKNR